LWQEGHTAHATADEAKKEARQMLDVYTEMFQNALAIPVIRGLKTEKEKFAGAVETYTVESIMHDGKALQSGTSHYLGDGFAKSFDIKFTDENNELQYVHQSSWGVSTRMMGGLIMVHGDNDGLVLPPMVAPIQVVIVPIAQNKEGVLEEANYLMSEIKRYARVKLDSSDKSPGWKFSEYEMKGVPIRVEIGPKDIEAREVVLVRRDTGKKTTVRIAEIGEEVDELLKDIQVNLLKKAKVSLKEKTYKATNLEEFEKILNETPGFIKAQWCGSVTCEEKIKEKTSATTRCIPFEQEKISDTCICCGKPADTMVYFAKAY